MNIRTNYPLQQMQVRSNSKNLQHNSSPIQEHNSQELASSSVCFTGLGDIFRKSVKLDKEAKEFIDYAAGALNINASTMLSAARGKSKEQMGFLSSMVDHFNAQNYYAAPDKKENGKVVLDLFNRILKPKNAHRRMVEQTQLTMTDIKKCFDICQDNPKKIEKVQEAYEKLSHTTDNKSLTMQIMESPNSEEYINNIDKYIPHFEAQKEVEGLIAGLDKQMATQTVDISSAHQRKIADRVIKGFPANSVLKAEDFISNASIDSQRIISAVKIKLAPTAETIEQGDSNGLIKIFNSTTKENAEFRENFLDANYHNFGSRDNVGKNEINELAGLFELTDKDPNAKQFLDKLSNENVGFGRAGAFLELFDKVGSEQLNRDSKKVIKLIKQDTRNSFQTVMDHYENKTESVADKFLGSIKGLFGKKEKPAQKVPVTSLVTIEPMGYRPIIKPEVFKKPYIKPEIKVVPMEKESLLPTGKLDIPSITEVKPEPEVKKVKRSYVFFKPTPKKAPSAKKLAVINDVNGIIEKKLSERVMSEQSGIYADKATKMRAGLLPEIFESIKETRAAERAKGTFSRSKSVKNEDAIDLYTRINGKNKKLVNYMLKKRNADGTRMFTVKDIMNTLANANKEIIQGKNNSTKLNRFTAKDERAIYENIFEQKVAEHGKLQRVKSTKKA